MGEPGLRSGMPVFPNLTPLDPTGPHEILARLPGARTLLTWKTLDAAAPERAPQPVLDGVLQRAAPTQTRRAGPRRRPPMGFR